MYYVLDEKGEAKEATLLEWASFFEEPSARVVAKSKIGNLSVSTVFLGIDHNFSGQGDPVLWETMIFGGGDAREYQDRYTSRTAALAGHEKACEQARAWTAEDQP